jgi:hypothetical protein
MSKISRRHFAEGTGAGLAVEGAQPLAKNKYKIPLTAVIVKRTLASLGSA